SHDPSNFRTQVALKATRPRARARHQVGRVLASCEQCLGWLRTESTMEGVRGPIEVLLRIVNQMNDSLIPREKWRPKKIINEMIRNDLKDQCFINKYDL
ncbi:hypothetical protein Lal_00025482, partial [Lupinus albus]